MREVRVLYRASFFVEGVPQRVALSIEAQLHEAGRHRRATADGRAQVAEAEARAVGEVGRGGAVLGARVPVAGAEQHGGETGIPARGDETRLDRLAGLVGAAQGGGEGGGVIDHQQVAGGQQLRQRGRA